MNLKLAIRRLVKSPLVSTVAILSLGLGIGANAAIFSLFDQILLRALPVQRPEELVNLSSAGPKPGSQSCGQAGDCDHVFSYPMFRDLERQHRQNLAHGDFAGVDRSAKAAAIGALPTSVAARIRGTFCAASRLVPTASSSRM